MYSMDDKFMSAWETDYRDEVKVKATVGSHTYTSDDGTIDDMELTETIGDGDTLPIGQSGSSELLLTLAGVSPDGLSGTTVKAYVAIGDSAWCPLGVFRVDSISSSDNYETIKLTCYDALYYADRIDYESNLVFPTTLAKVLDEVNSRTGIKNDSSIIVPGFTVLKEPSGYTCRQMYEFIAGVIGANARMSREGLLQFASYAQTSAVSITGDVQYDDGGQLNHNNELKVDGLNIKCGNDTWQYSGGSDASIETFDASAAQDRSVLLDIYQNEDGTYMAEVTGSGPMMDFSGRDAVPWNKYLGALVSISFGDGVTSIGAHTCNCYGSGSSLTSVIIAGTVESIGADAFYFASELTYVRLGDGIKTIGRRAFGNCAKLDTVYFPETLETIGDYAFYSDSLLGKLNNIALPSSCTSIGAYAFYGCKNFYRIQFGSGIKTIGDAAFIGCALIKRIDLSGCNSLESIGKNAFQKLNIETVMLAGPVAIGGYAFDGCTSLKSVQLGQCVSIGDKAFNGCTAISAMLLPSTLESIGYAAFSGTLIEALTIPASCTNIAGGLYDAFDGANSLKQIAAASGGKYNSYSGVLYDDTTLFRVPYAYAGTSLPVKSGTTGIGSYCCKDVAAITSASLPDSIKTMQGNAFTKSAITAITIALKEGSISGAPWGATGATVTWTGGGENNG